MSNRPDSATALAAINRYAGSFAEDPAGYFQHVLRKQITPQQRQLCDALRTHRKVQGKAAHEVGKSFLAAGLVNWFFDSFPHSSIALTTAPTSKQVTDILWKEVRKGRHVARGGFPGPKAARLEEPGNPDHWAAGFTARDANAFQGRHAENVLIVFDEAAGVEDEFWEAAETMFGNSQNSYWLAIFNPVSVASPPYRQARNAKAGWHVVTLSCLDHPNIKRQLRGEPPIIPGAIQLPKLDRLLRQWSDAVHGDIDPALDVEWPPGSGQYLRPGPIAESRLLGRYPSSAVDTVWSEALIQRVEATRHDVKPEWPVQIGCDVARFGDDFTEIVVRKGCAVMHHEAHNGWRLDQTAGRLKQLCYRFQTKGHARNDQKKIPVLIDIGGLGAGVVDMAEDFNFIGINSSTESTQPDRYRNTRSELWFSTVEYARAGAIDVSRIGGSWESIRDQLLAPKYTIDMMGRLVVEEKDETKETCGRSPDGADAFNLAFLAGVGGSESVIGRV